MKLNQINKILRALNDEIEFNSDILKVVNKFQGLLVEAKDKVETENCLLDLTTFKFDSVISITSNFNDAGYFNKNDNVIRDYFKLNVLGHELFTNEILFELFQLKSNSIAICSMEKYGRSMIFPLLKIQEFIIYQNDFKLIHLKSRDSNMDFRVVFTDGHSRSTTAETLNRRMNSSTFIMKRDGKCFITKNGY